MTSCGDNNKGYNAEAGCFKKGDGCFKLNDDAEQLVQGSPVIAEDGVAIAKPAKAKSKKHIKRKPVKSGGVSLKAIASRERFDLTRGYRDYYLYNGKTWDTEPFATLDFGNDGRFYDDALEAHIVSTGSKTSDWVAILKGNGFMSYRFGEDGNPDITYFEKKADYVTDDWSFPEFGVVQYWDSDGLKREYNEHNCNANNCLLYRGGAYCSTNMGRYSGFNPFPAHGLFEEMARLSIYFFNGFSENIVTDEFTTYFAAGSQPAIGTTDFGNEPIGWVDNPSDDKLNEPFTGYDSTLVGIDQHLVARSLMGLIQRGTKEWVVGRPKIGTSPPLSGPQNWYTPGSLQLVSQAVYDAVDSREQNKFTQFVSVPFPGTSFTNYYLWNSDTYFQLSTIEWGKQANEKIEIGNCYPVAYSSYTTATVTEHTRSFNTLAGIYRSSGFPRSSGSSSSSGGSTLYYSDDASKPNAFLSYNDAETSFDPMFFTYTDMSASASRSRNAYNFTIGGFSNTQSTRGDMRWSRRDVLISMENQPSVIAPGKTLPCTFKLQTGGYRTSLQKFDDSKLLRSDVFRYNTETFPSEIATDDDDFVWSPQIFDMHEPLLIAYKGTHSIYIRRQKSADQSSYERTVQDSDDMAEDWEYFLFVKATGISYELVIAPELAISISEMFSEHIPENILSGSFSRSKQAPCRANQSFGALCVYNKQLVLQYAETPKEYPFALDDTEAPQVLLGEEPIPVAYGLIALDDELLIATIQGPPEGFKPDLKLKPWEHAEEEHIQLDSISYFAP